MKKTVLRDEVVDYLLEGIFEGRFEPGERVVETRVSRELQVSQGAVREAIRDLIATGALEAEPFKGTRVKKIEACDLRDYYETRGELERIAIESLGSKVELTSEDLIELEDYVQGIADGVEQGDISRIRKMDIRFHERIMELADNEFLYRAWKSLGHPYWLALGLHYKVSEQEALDQIHTHRAIFEALKSGEYSEASRLNISHFFDVSLMEKQGVEQ